MAFWPRPLDRSAATRRFSAREIGSFDPRLYTLGLDEKHLFYDFSRNRGFDPVFDPTFLHELAHFVQYATTLYGLHLNALDRYQNSIVRSFCNDYLSLYPDSSIYVPIYDWMQAEAKNSRAFARIRPLKAKYIEPWVHAEFLWQVLEGILNADQYAAVESFATIDPTASVRATDKGACPLTTHPEGIVGASQIGECFAGCHELLALRTMERDDPRSVDFDEECEKRFADDRYVHLFRLIYDNTGFMSPHRLVLVSAALCEIALLTPMHEAFASSRSNDTTWEHLHPGWRFIHALDVVERVKPLDLERFQDDYPRFLDDICTELIWPPVTEVIKRAASLKASPGDLVGEMVVEAHKLRTSHPTAFAWPLHEHNWSTLWTRFFRTYLPPITLQDGQERYLAGSRAAEGHYFASTATRVGRRLMLDGDLEHLVPERIVAQGISEGYEDVENLVLRNLWGFSKAQIKPLYERHSPEAGT